MSSQGQAGPLRAGAAAVDITPTRFPVNMPGGFLPNMAESAHDPLHARALVFDDGATALALVVVDNLGVVADVVVEAKTIAAERCGIASENMVVASTHSHTAPHSCVLDGPPEATGYRKIVTDGIVEAIVRAQEALRPAGIGVGMHALPEEVFNRRWFLRPGAMQPNPFGEMDLVKMNPGTSADVLLHPAGPTDPDLTILSVVEEDSGEPLALFANYSLHYVGHIPKAMVSADYYGEFARLMPARLRAGDRFVAIMSNGTSGNINNIPFGVVRPPREPFEQVRLVAARAADAAWSAQVGIREHRTDACLAMVQRNIDLRLRRPTAEQAAHANAVLALTDETEIAKLPRLAAHYARRTLALAEADEMLTVPLQALRIGELAICAIPFETFVETGLNLKQRSPFPRTLVMGIANGYNGYLPTPEQHRLGGYETWLGTNRVQEDASDIITNNLLEMLAELSV